MLPRWVWDYIRSTMEGGSYAEVRGGWFRDAVAPRHSVRPTVSEVSSPCPTKRDAYLRRVVRVSMEDSESLRLGRLVHEVFLTPFRESIPFSQLDNRFESIINEHGDLGNKYRAQLYEIYTKAVAMSLNAREEVYPLALNRQYREHPLGYPTSLSPTYWWASYLWN